MDRYHREAIALRRRSAGAGRKWVVFGDEQNPAHAGVVPDADDPDHDVPRKQALWGNLMGGGSGVEWYFGHKYAHMDINCEDWRSRDHMWDQTRYALEFFQEYLPFDRMEPADELTSNETDYCFAQPGEVYAIYLPDGGTTDLDLAAGDYTIRWYAPRSGGELQKGSIQQVTGPGTHSIGEAPRDRDRDWAILISKQ
jgi:collagenase-like protein with putative collagen-binding domain